MPACWGWDLVKEIHKEHLGQRLKKRKLSQLRYLAIDEFATHSGHLYMTVVLDLESGQIVSLHEGKDASALVACLRRLKRRCQSLRAIAIDMSNAYRKAIRQVFAGKVDVVHDPYHVVALANQAIDQTRRLINLYKESLHYRMTNPDPGEDDRIGTAISHFLARHLALYRYRSDLIHQELIPRT